MSFIRNTDKLVEGLQNKWFTNVRAKSAVQSDLDQLASDISAEASSRAAAISSEQSARESAVSSLDSRLDVLEADPVTKAYVDGEVSDLQGQINNVISNIDAGALDSLTEIVAAFQAADSNLNNAITNLSNSAGSDLQDEIDARIAADNALDARLDVLEADPTTKTYVDGIQSALDARLDVLEADPVSKTYVDGAVSSEQSARISADNALDARLDVLEGADSVEGSVAKAEKDAKDYADSIVDAEESARIAAVSAEESARISADNALDARLDVLEADPTTKTYVDGEVSDLQGQVNTEKGRIDAILSAADADKDSFAEIVSLINSVDTTNDQAFAGYVASNDAALAAEISARQSADTTLQNNINGLFASKSTSDLAEGSRLYYTQGRFDSAFAAKSTTNLVEGSNLYYTTARVQADAAKRDLSNLSSVAINTNLLFGTDASSNIGAMGANRPNKGYFVYGIQIGGSTEQLGSNNNGAIWTVADSDVATDPRFGGVRYSSNASAQHRVSFRRSRGSLASPESIQSGDNIGRLTWSGMGDGAFRDGAQIIVKSSDVFSSSSAPSLFQFQLTNSVSSPLETVMQLNADKSAMHYGTLGVQMSSSSSSVYQFLVDGLSGSQVQAAVRSSQNSSGNGANLQLEKSRDNGGTPDYLQSGDLIGRFTVRPWAGTGYSGHAHMAGVATEQHSSSARGTKLVFAATPSASVTRVDVMSVLGEKVEMYKPLEVPVGWELLRPTDSIASRGFGKMIFEDFTDASGNAQTQIKFRLQRNSSDSTERLPMQLQADHAIFGRGLAYRTVRKNANYTVANSEPFQVAQAVNITYTLPSSPVSGQVHVFKDSTGNCNNSNPITISAPAGTSIDGDASYQLTAPYESINMIWESTIGMWLKM